MSTPYTAYNANSADQSAGMTDMTIAMELMMAAKHSVRNLAVALTESPSPEVRALLQQQIHTGISKHQEITELMMAKGWFRPYELAEQYRLDVQAADSAIAASRNI